MAKTDAISKLEAVRRALNELGDDAKPQEIADHLKNKFQLDITLAHVSNYKSKIQRAGKKNRGRPRKIVAATATAQEMQGRSNDSQRTRPAGERGSGSISIEDIKAVKELADRLGMDKLQDLARVLDK